MRERSFVQRNKRVSLRELTDLVALRPPGEQEKRAAGRIPEAMAAEVPEAQVRAFERAGWVFQERDARDETPTGSSRATVFVKPGGRLALGTNTLTVQLQGDPSDEEAAAILKPFGVELLQRLKFAPGLFRAAVMDGARGDTVDLANELVETGIVRFAEPELIEGLGGRQ
ncbi:MAG: hypothetical protein FJX77_00365 [Armatimonadetes bacterium]|nr:hypothetical protein [Armatimonadota bacterium]